MFSLGFPMCFHLFPAGSAYFPTFSLEVSLPGLAVANPWPSGEEGDGTTRRQGIDQGSTGRPGYGWFGTWWNMVNIGIGQLFGSIGHNIWNNTWLLWLSIPYGSIRSGQGVWLMGLSTFSDSVWNMAFMTFHTLWIQPYLLRKWPRGMIDGVKYLLRQCLEHGFYDFPYPMDLAVPS